VLSFGLGSAGTPARTAGVPDAILFAAVNNTLVLLVAFEMLAAVVVIVGARRMAR
jgi:hypothetical protein